MGIFKRILVLGGVTFHLAHAVDLGTSVSTSVESNLAGLDEAGHSASAQLSLAPTLKVSESLRLSAQFAFAQDLSGEGNASIEDGLLSASLAHDVLGKYLSLRWGGSLSLPFSENSRSRAGLYTTLGLGPIVSLKTAGLELDWLRVTYRITGLRSLHRYTTSSVGSSNPAWGLSQRVDLGFQLSSRLSLTLLQSYSTVRTYEGRSRSTFRYGQELALQITPPLSLELGHTNGGSLYKPDGETSNLALFNRDSASIYGGVTYVF